MPRREKPPVADGNRHVLAIAANLRQRARSMSLADRAGRFASVGALTSLAYVLVVSFYTELAGTAPKLSSALAYLTVLPLNFLGHRKITFRSSAKAGAEFFRFIALHVVNIGVGVGGMAAAVDWLGLSYWIGSFAAVVLVPISTFIVMDLWVFSADDKHR